MEISTSLNVFTDQSVEEAIRRCKEAGFRSLDFNYWDYQEYVLGLTPEEEEAWARDIRLHAEHYGVRFTQMHGPVHGRSFQDMVLGLNTDSFFELMKRSIRTAAILGVPWVVLHPGQSTIKGDEPYKDVVDFNCEYFKLLIPTLEETNVGIALENIFDRSSGIGANDELGHSRRIYCAIPGELVELIDRLNHPLVGACWDTGHAHKQGLRQGDGIRMLGSRLKTLHIQDNNGIWDQHLLPYQGTIDWNEVIEALKEIGYQGDFTYEAHNSIRMLPEELRDAGLVYSAQVARYLVEKMPLEVSSK
jgi:sugar phosphate isomerase/epimerase